MNHKYLTLADAAYIARVLPQTLVKALQLDATLPGHIPSKRHGNRWLVSTEHLDTERMLTVRDVATLKEVPEQTVYRAVKQHDVGFVRVGGSVRFRRADVAEWRPESTPE